MSSNITQTILQEFRKREAEIKKEAEERDRVSAVQLKESEKKLKDIRSQLDAARINCASMISDYMAVENAEGAKVTARLQASEVTLAKVKNNPAVLKDFLEKGLSDDALQKKAAGEAAGKLTAGIAVIRDQSRMILELERQESDCLLNIFYHQSEPARLQVVKLTSEIETLNHAISFITEGGPQSRYTRDEKRDALTRASGRFISGKTWGPLDVDGLRNMRFNAEIADVFLPSLEAIIQEVKPGQKINLMLLSGMTTQGAPKLTYRLEVPEGVMLTTTNAGEKK